MPPGMMRHVRISLWMSAGRVSAHWRVMSPSLAWVAPSAPSWLDRTSAMRTMRESADSPGSTVLNVSARNSALASVRIWDR